jgi:Predicted aminopeptidases
MRDRFEAMAADCIKRVESLIEEFGPRPAGSEAGKATAAALAEEFASYCDESGLETFEAHPLSFYSYMKILPPIYALGICSFFLPRGFSLAAAVLVALGVASMVVIFGRYSPALDRAFPAGTCANAWGFIEPGTGEIRRQVILSGHHDSAYATRVFESRFSRFASLALLLPYLFIAAELILLVARFLGGLGPDTAVLLILGAGLPSLGVYFFAIDIRRPVPGAGDNLISSVMVARIGRYIKEERPELLEGTRVWLVSFDAEEAGLRGSSFFFGSRKDRFASVPTTHINFDSLFNPRELRAATKDLNGQVPLDGELAARLIATAKALGIDMQPFEFSFPLGATDAAESARIGLSSSSIVAQSVSPLSGDFVYHTRRDIASAIDPEVVAICMRIIAETLRT